MVALLMCSSLKAPPVRRTKTVRQRTSPARQLVDRKSALSGTHLLLKGRKSTDRMKHTTAVGVFKCLRTGLRSFHGPCVTRSGQSLAVDSPGLDRPIGMACLRDAAIERHMRVHAEPAAGLAGKHLGKHHGVPAGPRK